MNKKLTFPELAELLSVATNTSKRMSELALREMFAVISGKLLDGESVKIDGLGVFKVTEVNSRRSVNVNTGEAIEIPGHSKITFVADKRLAEAVNAPFASFESVVLDDDVTADMLTAIDNAEPAEPAAESSEFSEFSEHSELSEPVAEPAEPAAEPVEPSEFSEPSELSELSEPSELSEFSEPSELSEPAAEEPAEPAAEPVEEEDAQGGAIHVSQSDDDYYYDDDDDDSWWQRHRTLKGFLMGVVAGAALYAAADFAIKYYEDNRKVVSAETIEADDGEVVAADTLPSDTLADKASPKDSLKPTASTQSEPAKSTAVKQVTDTVTGSYFLTRMARRHYGNGHFWVYIYEENKGKISNPNNVRPGTVVVIPDAKKYGIDKDNPQSVEAAKRKEGEIQRKFL
ncbi:MAG: HU family DNA-binding protein [Muribaculaceae bacterium]